MSSPPANSTVHLLSKKSRQLHRDTFFFHPHLTSWLIGGLNQRLTPVTSAKFQRWGRILDPKLLNFELRPITIEKTSGVLAYRKVPSGPPIPPDSTAPLPPGEYAWYVTDTTPYAPAPLNNIYPGTTFADLKSGAGKPGRLERLAEFLPWYHMPSSVVQYVATRDGCCMITGSSSTSIECEVSWIFPPAWAAWLASSRYYNNHVAISIPSNAILMQKDLIDAFHNNAFGIDVDDDYRLVIFRDSERAQELLTGSNSQAYFRRPGSRQLTGPDDHFLREHFRHCLRVHLLHGDIHEDYPQEVVVKALAQLGLWERDDVAAPLDDPRWSTELGKEILECHLRMQLEMSGYDSSDDDDN